MPEYRVHMTLSQNIALVVRASDGGEAISKALERALEVDFEPSQIYDTGLDCINSDDFTGTVDDPEFNIYGK